MTPRVLIVGAGPTGLVLAIWLAERGVPFRLIDRTAEPGTTSRAMAVHARTLEFYRMLGFADEVVSEGRIYAVANLWVKGRRVGGIRVGEAGEGISEYPFILTYPQDEHERFLIRRLESLGGAVERRTTLLGFVQDGDGVRAEIQRPDGSAESIAVDYLCGCDGAHSTTRKSLEVGFPGGLYEQAFFVCDAGVAGATCDGELHGCLGDADFCLVFPAKGENRSRLIGTIPKELVPLADDHTLAIDHLRDHVKSLTHLTIERSNWFSTYRIHHRVADAFSKGRVFLLGDAAHIHSPAGGQGMNTGIGDAVNLAWKLDDVLKNAADRKLLESYAPERRAFALRLVETTDQAFQGLVGSSPRVRFLRLNVVSRLLPILTRFMWVRRLMYRVVSQTGLRYHASPISRGAVGKIRAGDRLPWIVLSDGRSNYDGLSSLTWRIQTYGGAGSGPSSSGDAIPREDFPWTPVARDAGFERGTAYVVRPDGHVGYVGSPDGVEAYLREVRGR